MIKFKENNIFLGLSRAFLRNILKNKVCYEHLILLDGRIFFVKLQENSNKLIRAAYKQNEIMPVRCLSFEVKLNSMQVKFIVIIITTFEKQLQSSSDHPQIAKDLLKTDIYNFSSFSQVFNAFSKTIFCSR